jgi:hypothetical protein
MVSIVGVCAIFVTLNPILNNISQNKMRKKIKKLEKDYKLVINKFEKLSKELTIIAQNNNTKFPEE